MKPKHKVVKKHAEDAVPETTSQEEVPGAENQVEPEPEPELDEPTPVKQSKPATEPWMAENAPDSAARRGYLGLSRNKKGFQTRWVRYDSVDRRKAQGYVLAKAEDFDSTADENGMIRRNELVLMVVPKEIFDGRREEVAQQTKLQAKSAKREFLQERQAAEKKLGHSLAIRGENRDDE